MWNNYLFTCVEEDSQYKLKTTTFFICKKQRQREERTLFPGEELGRVVCFPVFAVEPGTLHCVAGGPVDEPLHRIYIQLLSHGQDRQRLLLTPIQVPSVDLVDKHFIFFII